MPPDNRYLVHLSMSMYRCKISGGSMNVESFTIGFFQKAVPIKGALPTAGADLER